MLTRPGTAIYNPPGTSVNSVTAAIDPNLGSAADLALVVTAGVLTSPVIRIFINTDTGELEVWRLLAGTDATSAGIQRPADYGAGNLVVWYKAGS